MSFKDRLRRIGAAWRTFDADVTELHERQALVQRPWEEEFLHWSFDGRQWCLHGRLAPPPGRRRVGVTRGGWCPALAVRDQHPTG